MRPAPDDVLRRELVALHVKTIRRREGETDLSLALEIYLAELKRYPGDIALDAVRGWRYKFFPAWPELRDRIERDWRFAKRTLRMKALRDYLDGQPRGIKSRPTDAQHARMAEYVQQSRNALTGHAAPVWTHEQVEALARVDAVHGERARATGGKFVAVGALAKGISPE